MGRILRADYAQRYLLPPSVEDWIAPDDPARFIRDFVDALKLEALGFGIPAGADGRPAYSADLLLKAWIYGYFMKIRSSRALESACRRDMGLIWLTGCHTPDHNTLWRFWGANRQALKQVFRQSVHVAMKAEMVGLVLQAVDGTKIAAQSSTATAWRRKTLTKSAATLDAAIEEILSETERSGPSGLPSERLPADLIDAQARRAVVAEKLAELEAEGRRSLHSAEREAVMLPCEGRKRLGYNAQSVVDAKERIVVAADVAAEENDSAQLNRMIEQAEENTGSSGAQSVADKGYFNGKQIAEAEELGRDVLVHAPDDYRGDGTRFHHARFTYCAERDVFVCPLGEELAYWRTRKKQRHPDQRTRVYRCRNGDCPHREECTRQKRGRTVNKDIHHESVRRQLDRQQTAEAAEAMARRKEIVELPFAWIKQHLGFRRWSLRGLPNVRAQWAMLCAVVNLRRLYAIWRVGKLKMA